MSVLKEGLVQELAQMSRALIDLGWETIQVGCSEAEVYNPEEFDESMQKFLASLAFSDEGHECLYWIGDYEVYIEMTLLDGKAVEDDGGLTALSEIKLQALLAKFSGYYLHALRMDN